MIMNYEGILEFKGTWRRYQARVLEHADRYMADGKIHIVAAPGSGKTTLGIELIRRMNGKALILAPSITIREQWIARIEEAFLCEGIQGEDYLSQNLKQPKAITVATYQALHSAMTRFQGIQEDAGEDSGTGTDECPAKTETKEVDYSGFDLVGTMKEAGIEVLCLDECHHLRSEWWKALEEFKKQVNNLKIIALTATPPYDSTPAMWTRYMNMSSGSLGQGISAAVGMALSAKLSHDDYRVYTLLGDGEIQEGQVWEASMFAGHRKLDNLVVIVDNNGLQIDGNIADVCSPYPIDKKFEAFNFHVIADVDAHDFEALRAAFKEARETKGMPTAIILKSVKGKGVSFMENKAGWHGKAPNDEEYAIAMDELEKAGEALCQK